MMIKHPHGHCLLLLSTLLGACTVGPNFKPPTPQTPEHWSTHATAQPAATPAATPAAAAAAAGGVVVEQTGQLGDWWTGFADPQLDSLIARAVSSNLDLRAAVLRIDEARAQRDISASAMWPTLAVDGSFNRQRFSETTPTGALFTSVGSAHLPGGASTSVPNPYNQFQLSGTASWELDLFGRVRRAVEASQAGLQVSIEDQRAVLVALLADVAGAYMDLRGAQARLAVTRENLATMDDLLELTRQRRAAGLTTHIDVGNAMAQSALTRAQIPAFELQITVDINQLSELLGLAPDALRAELESPAAVPRATREVPIGVPADLARRRPDIREAEANLHAATAEVGVATANLYPRLTLGGTGGVQSETAGNLLEWASRFVTLGPTIDVPVFDRGRWKSVHLYDVRSQEAALAYQRTVLNALHEVENALAAYAADQNRREWLDSTVVQDREVLGLTRQRYESGVSSFVDVLDSERSLQQNELALADTTTAVSSDLVRLYRALGGGWQSGEQPGA
jgi:NodT family efflux transporter outer membrane factor (OMF) lipoprotein